MKIGFHAQTRKVANHAIAHPDYKPNLGAPASRRRVGWFQKTHTTGETPALPGNTGRFMVQMQILQTEEAPFAH